MIRTFLFDMGNVLVTFCHERMCRQIGNVCGLSVDEVRKNLIASGLQWKFERGDVCPDEFHSQWETFAATRISRESLSVASSDIFHPNESLRPILDQLKAKGHRLVLLSNTTVWHFEFIQQKFEVLKPFDDFVLSYQARAMKPERRIFEAALDKIDCDPKDCFYTDDIADYVQAGREIGLDAEVFTTAESFVHQITQRGVTL